MRNHMHNTMEGKKYLQQETFSFGEGVAPQLDGCVEESTILQFFLSESDPPAAAAKERKEKSLTRPTKAREVS
ncbi:unnamed protein product [Calypogeia fissa]